MVSRSAVSQLPNSDILRLDRSNGESEPDKRHRKPMTKVEKARIKNTGLKVWCEHCSIRIAPNEEQIAVREKIYHVRCYLKLPAIAKPKS